MNVHPTSPPNFFDYQGKAASVPPVLLMSEPQEKRQLAALMLRNVPGLYRDFSQVDLESSRRIVAQVLAVVEILFEETK